VHAPGSTVAEISYHGIRLVVQIDGQVGDSVVAQPKNEVLQQRPPPDGQHGLGPLQGQWPQPGALASSQDHRLHHYFIHTGSQSLKSLASSRR